LQDAWNELANFEQLNVSALYNRSANDVTKCAEPNEDGLQAVVTELKKEITILRAALNKKTYELHKLKKDLCHESTLMAKMADLDKEICTLKQEKLKLSENLREKIQLMEHENVKLSKMLESSSKEVQNLKSRILNQDEEIDMLCRKSVTVSRGLKEKCEEIRKLTSENSELKKENKELNDEIVKNSLYCPNKDTTDVLLNNSRLKDEMCSMKNNRFVPPNTLETKIHGVRVKQLSKNSSQRDEDYSLKCCGTKAAELHMHETENPKLKDEISSFSYEIISSESTKEKTAPKWGAVNKNVTIKAVSEKIAKEVTVKVKRHTLEKSLLKDVDRLSNELKERAEEVNELKSKLKEEQLQAENLRREVLVHQEENVKLSKILNQKMHDECLRIADTQSVVLNNISMTENANFLKAVSQKCEELDGRRLKTETPSPSRTWTSENPQLRMSECTNQMMKVNLQDWKLNCLQKKVAWQKNLIRRIQKRELKLKTNMEQCKKILLYYFCTITHVL
jgi:Chromosome segregation ATPases